MKVTEPTYLVIPFEQLKEAKRQAGKLENGQNALEFDADKKLWFARPGADLSKLSQWRTDTALVMSAQGDPQQEFGDFIRVLGENSAGLLKWMEKLTVSQWMMINPGNSQGFM
uniref:DUF5710 domain-containing protein n=1 Tax=Serratia grimesii TaxID=82995 RepID=UPI001F4C4AA1|nr:DUF5710 domain-containing protein [Serratia grimesii]ULG12642.1 SogL [Serratia grimesii]